MTVPLLSFRLPLISAILLILPAGLLRAQPANREIEELRRLIVDQQRQIDELRRELRGQRAVPPPSAVTATPAIATPPATSPVTEEAPTQIRIGQASITPVGFLDFTSVTRSRNAGSGIATNFGSVPFANTQAGHLTETLFSPQNSRLGFRVDATVRGMPILAYLESDFLGQLGNPPNGSIAVSSNSFPLRLRLFFINLRRNKFEFLAGQSWSMMTPNRYGISPLRGDLFYTYVIDPNYQAGLVWGRIPGVRALYHASDKVTLGISLENSTPYVGGSAGGGIITPPSALSGLLGTQVNNGTTVLAAPALHPDVIAKIAFDPGRRFHGEIAGVEITNHVVNPATSQVFTKAGFGASANFNFELIPNLRLLSNNYWSNGGGRYIFGQAPDFILRSNGAISNVRSGSTLAGVEVTAGHTQYYGYYGGVYVQRNTAIDTNGARVGYGYPGSPGSHNRAIQEITFGSDTRIWSDNRYGALNLMFQYSYLQRNPWFVAAGQPDHANLHMGYVNLRFTLPGAVTTTTRRQ